MFKDSDGKETIGFCLWCNRDFYTMEEVIEHNSDNMAACPAFSAYFAAQAEDNSGSEPP